MERQYQPSWCVFVDFELCSVAKVNDHPNFYMVICCPESRFSCSGSPDISQMETWYFRYHLSALIWDKESSNDVADCFQVFVDCGVREEAKGHRIRIKISVNLLSYGSRSQNPCSEQQVWLIRFRWSQICDHMKGPSHRSAIHLVFIQRIHRIGFTKVMMKSANHLSITDVCFEQRKSQMYSNFLSDHLKRVIISEKILKSQSRTQSSNSLPHCGCWMAWNSTRQENQQKNSAHEVNSNQLVKKYQKWHKKHVYCKVFTNEHDHIFGSIIRIVSPWERTHVSKSFIQLLPVT
jgi:hypothetical protein